MIQEFSFSWNGRQWNGYFNALARETVTAHFEDESIRDAVGQKLTYTKGATGIAIVARHIPAQPGIYEAIQRGVELRLGASLQQYLN